ncbi:unnamed protein product, partial [Dicrocoelium dendriticum]
MGRNGYYRYVTGAEANTHFWQVPEGQLINFTHVFHFLAVSSLDMAAAESASLIGHLQHVVIAQSDVVAAILRIQLPTVYPLSSLDQLNSAFRILSALSESGQQCELLHSWESQLLAVVLLRNPV